jgi:hypothetical protein
VRLPLGSNGRPRQAKERKPSHYCGKVRLASGWTIAHCLCLKGKTPLTMECCGCFYVHSVQDGKPFVQWLDPRTLEYGFAIVKKGEAEA